MYFFFFVKAISYFNECSRSISVAFGLDPLSFRASAPQEGCLLLPGLQLMETGSLGWYGGYIIIAVDSDESWFLLLANYCRGVLEEAGRVPPGCYQPDMKRLNDSL